MDKQNDEDGQAGRRGLTLPTYKRTNTSAIIIGGYHFSVVKCQPVKYKDAE
jgi:hypothetical protein